MALALFRQSVNPDVMTCRSPRSIPLSSLLFLIMVLFSLVGCGQRTQLVMLGLAADCPPDQAKTRIDRPILKGTDGRYLSGGLIYTTQGNNISYIAFPKDHEEVVRVNTPALGLANVIHTSHPPGTSILKTVNQSFPSEHGLGFVTKATKKGDVVTRDNPHPRVSWSVQQYVYFPEHVVRVSSWLVKGDVDADYRLIQEIARTMAIRADLAAIPLDLFQSIETDYQSEIARLRAASPGK